MNPVPPSNIPPISLERSSERGHRAIYTCELQSRGHGRNIVNRDEEHERCHRRDKKVCHRTDREETRSEKEREGERKKREIGRETKDEITHFEGTNSMISPPSCSHSSFPSSLLMFCCLLPLPLHPVESSPSPLLPTETPALHSPGADDDDESKKKKEEERKKREQLKMGKANSRTQNNDVLIYVRYDHSCSTTVNTKRDCRKGKEESLDEWEATHSTNNSTTNYSSSTARD